MNGDTFFKKCHGRARRADDVRGKKGGGGMQRRKIAGGVRGRGREGDVMNGGGNGGKQ